MMSNMVVHFSSSQALMDRTVSASCRMLAWVLLAALAFCFWPQAAWADHLCAGRYDEYTVSEVYDQTGNIVEYWCEWSSGGSGGAADMRYYSPEEWKAFAEHAAQAEAADAEKRKLAAQRYHQLEEGLWFMPGEEPFAGWWSGSASGSNPEIGNSNVASDCTASFWTLGGAVILFTPGGQNGVAMISYMGSSIPVPDKTQSRKFSLTQSGETQIVKATISRVGLGKKRMGMVSFAVPSGSILVGAIEDVQDYSLADQGKTIFSGQWHDGLRVRDALARCLAKR